MVRTVSGLSFDGLRRGLWNLRFRSWVEVVVADMKLGLSCLRSRTLLRHDGQLRDEATIPRAHHNCCGREKNACTWESLVWGRVELKAVLSFREKIWDWVPMRVLVVPIAWVGTGGVNTCAMLYKGS